MRNQYANPSLPPLHFHGINKSLNIDEDAPLLNLPPELAHRCLAEFCDWGELARLATVQSSWTSLLRDAATHGGIEAKWNLAKALLEGTNGLQRNPALAVKYLSELAGGEVRQTQDESLKEDPHRSLGNKKSEVFVPAMKKLASCYLTGDGVEADSDSGIRWLEAAHTVGGDIDAAHELAIIFEYGEYDVKVDVVLAAEWFLKAAKGGHIEGMAEYAMCCELGCGREQNDEEALEWYTKAANAGHVPSNFSVGEAFEEARGVPQNDEEACLWYYKAAVEGDEDSKKALRRLRDIARIVLPGVAGILDA